MRRSAHRATVGGAGRGGIVRYAQGSLEFRAGAAMMRGVLAGLVLFLAVAAPAIGQQDLLLRFSATPGQQVQRLFQVHTRIEARAADAPVRIRETARLGAVREQAVVSPPTEQVLHATFDSLRVRQREGTGPWEEVRVDTVHDLWLQIALDERLAVRRRIGPADAPHGALLQHLVTGFPGLVLPERPVRPSTRWELETELRAAEITGGATPGPATAVLAVSMAVAVDSLVARAADTLAYLTLRGSIPVTRQRAADGVVTTYRGEVVGSLVWSSGWNTFVSAATRTSLRADVEGPGAAAGFTVETTLRQAVVPSP